jgi:hypothetical protein
MPDRSTLRNSVVAGFHSCTIDQPHQLPLSAAREIYQLLNCAVIIVSIDARLLYARRLEH